jgi:hypothetical protein
MPLDKLFRNDFTAAQRRRQFEEDQRRLRQPPPTSTYRDQSHIDMMLEGGRFAAEATIAGADPALHYPKLPADNPWSGNNPIEGPLGYSVEDQAPVGEPFEQKAAEEIARARAESSVPGVDRAGYENPSAASVPSPADGERSPPGADPLPAKVREVLRRGIRPTKENIR